jgi:lipopolysaccharide transport system permease protein
MFDSKVTYIAAKRRKRDYWIDLWRHRELFFILAKRDISVRYKQTAIGAAWSIFRPLMTLVVTVFAFSKVAKMPSEVGVPYPIMAFTGVLIWLFFSQMFSQISNSIVGGGNLVSKVYIPRLIIPLSSLASGLLDFLIGMGLFTLLALFYGFSVGFQVLLLPVFVIMAYACALGLGLFFATINVRFRDIAQIVPFVVQFGFLHRQ